MKCNNCKRKDYCEAHSIENDSCVASGYSDYVPQTNYDRIISKSPGELAEFLWTYGGVGVCPPTKCTSEKCGAEKCWLDWLKEVADIE